MFFIDVHEPDDAEKLFEQLLDDQDVLVIALNTNDKPDYYWKDIAGHTRGWERKQLGEALSDLDAVEYQLNHHLEFIEDLTLVIEGVGVPTPQGIQTYKLTDNQKFFTRSMAMPPNHAHPALVSRYTRLKAALRLAGVNVVETSHWYMTVNEIAAHYIETNKEERTTLRRYITPHIAPMYQNPHVENLMRMKENGLGPVNAQKLIDKFGTVHALFMAEFTSIAIEIGKVKTEKFFQSIGRAR